jgi:hypothetical protein
MIETGDKEQAISLAQSVINRFPRQSKFFKRLEALATARLTRLVDAEKFTAPFVVPVSQNGGSCMNMPRSCENWENWKTLCV